MMPLMIGRFQPFHKGHLYAVKYILDRHQSLVIGVGSAFESHTLKNPFTFAERLEMIIQALDSEKISREQYLIIPIPDADYHMLWVSIVKMLVPRFSIVYSNDPLTRRLFKEEGYKVEGIPLYSREIYSGEEFRRRVISGENWKELLPSSVAEYIETNKLHERIIELASTDKPYKKIDFTKLI